MLNEQDIINIRKEFPILDTKIEGKPLIYLDNAATSQTPDCVVDTISYMYRNLKANGHRGVHTLSQLATDKQEESREKVRQYINAASTQEIIFTRGTTEAINLVASSFGGTLTHGDEIIITAMEHHANIVPWQLLQRNKRIRLRIVPINEQGEIKIDAYKDLFTENTRFVAISHVSNVLGTINPVKQMIEIAHSYGVPVLVDGAQAAACMKIDVQDLNADFYAFSAHKMYGPTGVGVLYGKKKFLEVIPPYQGGGEMIGTVTFEKTTFAKLPYKFEAGTPDFVGIAAFGTAIDYINGIGIENIAEYEDRLLKAATEQMMSIPGMRIFGTSENKSAIISFLVNGINSYDMGTILDKLGVAVRTGHHCAEPLMHRLGIDGTVRASFGVYNTMEEVEQFVNAVERVAKMF